MDTVFYFTVSHRGSISKSREGFFPSEDTAKAPGTAGRCAAHPPDTSAGREDFPVAAGTKDAHAPVEKTEHENRDVFHRTSLEAGFSG